MILNNTTNISTAIIDKISINYEILLNNNIYIIKVSLTNGHITIHKK